jgi:MFS family permease
MALAGTPVILGVAVTVFGVGVGVAMTAAYTTAGGALPDPARATGFGFLTSASLIGMAASPIIAGLIAHAGIRLVFLVDAVMLLVFGAAVHRVMEERAQETTGPAMEDA